MPRTRLAIALGALMAAGAVIVLTLVPSSPAEPHEDLVAVGAAPTTTTTWPETPPSVLVAHAETTTTTTTTTTTAPPPPPPTTTTTTTAPQPPTTQPPPTPVASLGSVEAIIRTAAREFGVPEEAFLRVARCESGLNPNAVNRSSGALGLFQHLPRYWGGRAAALGYGYGSWSDPMANARVSAWLWANEGAGHWVCR